VVSAIRRRVVHLLVHRFLIHVGESVGGILDGVRWMLGRKWLRIVQCK
jgi:hypothetical protein